MFKNNKKPNIVFILSDDQSTWSLGCYGNEEIHTPNIDRLAKEGVKFDNFYCVSPVCSPARASLLTGKIPSQHGIHDYICDGNGGENQKPIEYLEGQTGYTDILADNGYECGLTGKWHMGNGLKKQKGFDFWYVHQKGGGPYYNAPMIRDGELVNEPGYITDVITDEAIGFIKSKSNSDNPFYLSVHYTAPHSPWVDNHPKEYTDLYENCEFKTCPQGEPHPWALIDIMPGYTNPKENLIGYFAAVTAMDHNIGRILDTLDKENILEDTLIVFTADNGMNCGHHGIWGKGNGTFPINMYDNSVKVPFIISHKGVIPENKLSNRICSAYDFMPTLLDYLGFENKNKEEKKLPGKSFANSLLNESENNKDEEIVVFDEYGPVRMIRADKYKYIHRYPYGPHELYDLESDPGEVYNLYDQEKYSDVVLNMKKGLDEWFIKYVDPNIDGSKEPVLGGGQSDWAGLWGPGHNVYRENN